MNRTTDSTELLLRLVEETFPALIEDLLNEGRLDAARLADKAHVAEVIKSISPRLEMVPVSVALHADFMTSAKAAAERGQNQVAVVLVATTIEHYLNYYLLENLRRMDAPTTRDVEALMKQTIPAKIGSIVTLTGFRLPEGLMREVKEVFTLRNKLVHYQPKRLPLAAPDGNGRDGLMSQVKGVDTARLVRLPGEIEEELDNALRKRWPNYALAASVAKDIVKANRQHVHNEAELGD